MRFRVNALLSSWGICLILGLSAASCDSVALLGVNAVGERPDFELRASFAGGGVFLDAESARGEGFDPSTHTSTEFYRRIGGQAPYGEFDLIHQGLGFTFVDDQPGSALVHYRAAIVSRSTDDDGVVTHGVSSRSTPVTIELD